MDKQLFSGSVELVGMEVTAATLTGVPIDPTGYTVTVAVVPANVDPVDADFKTAAWQTAPLADPVAVLLIGTGTTRGALVPGAYRLWAKVSASPATPRLRCPDRLIIY